ncbi:MAG TPA: HEAT repeat domain-containing protein [Planctomycetota bacterium]|nr:HEAT repeat domain-containing protein [Planctomycetota bacterium]
MAYVPPTPGSTTSGQPTPSDVPKQDAHITDLPPEVRKSFLRSMVFFPSMVGAGICLLMFVGWIVLFNKPKTPEQFARELESPNMRERWEAARELSDHISHYGEPDSRIYSPVVLSALLKIMDSPELDKEAAAWSPSSAIKQDQEKTSLRWWAARIAGHIAARLTDPADKNRACAALLKALDERGALGVCAAQGLAYMRERRAVDPLAHILETSDDSLLRGISAKALGEIGAYHMTQPDGLEVADKVRLILTDAFQRENARAQKDEDLLDNLALALAEVHDSTGLARIHALEKSESENARLGARLALERLEKK